LNKFVSKNFFPKLTILAIDKFLEEKHGIKRSDINEAYLEKAKKLYYRKPPPNLSTLRAGSPILDEIPQSQKPSKNSSMITAPGRRVKLPTLSIDQSQKPFSKSPLRAEKSTAK